MLSLTGALTSLPYVAVVVAAGLVWNLLVDNPSVRHEARQGYVTEAELAAAKATLAERERQAQAALTAGNNFAAVLRQQATELAKQADEQEKEHAAYIAQLAAEKRACPLSADDIRRLRK